VKRLALAQKSFRDARVTALGGGLLSFALALLYVCVFPSVRDSFDQTQLPDWMQQMSGAAGSYTTPAGYMATEFFTAAPIILVIFAIVAGTGATAGEESAGTLDILLAQPLRRRTVIWQKSLGIWLAATIALFAAIPGVLLGQLFVDFDLRFDRLVIALFFTLPLLYFFVALGILAGAVLPTRAMAVVFTTAAAVAAYVLHTLGLLVDALHSARQFTPFYWADASKALVGDYELGWPVLLLACSVVFIALAALAFERRDVAAGTRLHLPRPNSWHRRQPPLPAPVAPDRTGGL
jgi:ABC-2 type transport system permease protein